jgi:hypothetical protein
MIEERAKSPRADILAADEPQPVDLSAVLDLIAISARVSRLCRVCARKIGSERMNPSLVLQ